MISTLKKKSYEWTQVLYFCVGVINVRIEVVYKIYKCRSVNKCHIFVKEVLETNCAPYSLSPASPHDRYDRCNRWENSSAIAAIIWKHFRNDRKDRWDTASRLYLSDGERSWILKWDYHSGSYPRMHSKLFNTVVFMEEILTVYTSTS